MNNNFIKLLLSQISFIYLLQHIKILTFYLAITSTFQTRRKICTSFTLYHAFFQSNKKILFIIIVFLPPYT